MTEEEKVSALYKKLLRLYPQGFRDRLGESMHQTFTDLYRVRQAEYGLFSFVFRTFAETGVEILQEHILTIKRGDDMKNMFSHPASAAITSLILSLLFGLTFVAFMFDIEPITKPLNALLTINGQGEINTLVVS